MQGEGFLEASGSMMPVMHTCVVGAPPRRPALAMGRQRDFELPEVFDETSLWKRMDQVAAMATVAAGRQVRRNQTHRCLWLPDCKGGIMRKPFRIFGNASWYHSIPAWSRRHALPRAWPPRGSRNKDIGLRLGRGAQ